MTNQKPDFNPQNRRLYLLLTRSLCHGDPLEVLEEAILGGVDLVQIREKPMSREEIPWVQAVWSRCKAHGIPMILNDHIDIAKELGVSAVHLGQEDLQESRRDGTLEKLRNLPLGISTHNLEEVKASEVLRPAYIGIGPCFATSTKGYKQGLPPSLLSRMQVEADRRGFPAFAIGGIHEGNLKDLLSLGIRRVAVSSCILRAQSPKKVAQTLKALLSPPKPESPVESLGQPRKEL